MDNPRYRRGCRALESSRGRLVAASSVVVAETASMRRSWHALATATFPAAAQHFAVIRIGQLAATEGAA